MSGANDDDKTFSVLARVALSKLQRPMFIRISSLLRRKNTE